MIKSPAAVCVVVGDLEVARQWYGQALERDPSYCDDNVVTFHVDGCLLSLRVGPTVSAPGPVVYWAVDDLLGEHSRLSAIAGGEVSNAVQLMAADQSTAQVTDPFGNVLGLMAIDAKKERKFRNQRAAEKVALQNVRETLDTLQQAEADQRALNRTVGWVAGIAVVVLVVVSVFWYMTGPRKPSPPTLPWKPPNNTAPR